MNSKPDFSILHVIRRMTEADIDAVMQIAASLPGAPHWERKAYLAAIQTDGQPQRVALVAINSRQIVGFAVASVVSGEAELESIAVVAGEQRVGCGTALLALLTMEVVNEGCSAMVLEVRASNLKARALYEKAGFVEAGRRWSYYSGPVEDAVLMRLKLKGPGYPQL